MIHSNECMCRNLYLIQIPTNALLIYMCFTILLKISKLLHLHTIPWRSRLELQSSTPCLSRNAYIYKLIYIGRFKTRITCSRRCYTIKMSPCSKGVCSDHEPIFKNPSPNGYECKILELVLKQQTNRQTSIRFHHSKVQITCHTRSRGGGGGGGVLTPPPP